MNKPDDDALRHELSESLAPKVLSNEEIERLLSEPSAEVADDVRWRRIALKARQLIHEQTSGRGSLVVRRNSSFANATVRVESIVAERDVNSVRQRRRAVAALAVSVLSLLAVLMWTAQNSERQQQLVAVQKASQQQRLQSICQSWSVARPVVSEAAQRVRVGDEVRTGERERRRVTLPDGSVLYVNESTAVTVESARRVRVSRGDVFVEVVPSFAEDQQEEKFEIVTPPRVLTALGTRLGVSAAENETELVVTQGRVKVDGMGDIVESGQQVNLPMAGDAALQNPAPQPAFRASEHLAWTRELFRAAEAALVPPSEHAGGAIVSVDPNGQKLKLSLRKYHVDVHIEDGFARTTIDQTYFNHTQQRLEGTFHFPLPPDASLSRLAMYVNGKLMEGGMAERQHARNTFEKIVHKMQDPALLEWVDGSTFRMRVFPLEARQEKRIVLSYTQRLSTAYGRTLYRFPGGHSLDVVRDWSAAIRVRHGKGERWHSPSHKLAADFEGEDLLLTGTESRSLTDRDLVVELGAPARGKDNSVVADDSKMPDAGSQRQAVRWSTARHDNHRYLMLRFRPGLQGSLKRPPRHWVFLFEASADRNSVLARTQIEIIRTLLENAEHTDTFNIVTANTKATVFSKNSLQCTEENVANAITYLEQTHLIGALDLQAALMASTKLVDAEKESLLVHTGSAIPVLGEQAQSELLKLLPQDAGYIGVGVGRAWAQSFMKQAAGKTGGYMTQINPDEEIAWRAFELSSVLNAPRLLNVAVKSDGGAVFLNIADTIVQGEEVCAIARFDKEERLPKSVTVTGLRNGKPWQRIVKVRNTAGNADYLPRSWAKLEIDRLLSLGAEAHKEDIVRLSKSMYVMSPFTSLLALENEEMYTQHNIDRGRKDHWALYPCPEEIAVVHEPTDNLSNSSLESLAGSLADWDKTIVQLFPQAASFNASDRRSGLATLGWAAPQLQQANDQAWKFLWNRQFVNGDRWLAQSSWLSDVTTSEFTMPAEVTDREAPLGGSYRYWDDVGLGIPMDSLVQFEVMQESGSVEQQLMEIVESFEEPAARQLVDAGQGMAPADSGFALISPSFAVNRSLVPLFDSSGDLSLRTTTSDVRFLGLTGVENSVWLDTYVPDVSLNGIADDQMFGRFRPEISRHHFSDGYDIGDVYTFYTVQSVDQFGAVSGIQRPEIRTPLLPVAPMLADDNALTFSYLFDDVQFFPLEANFHGNVDALRNWRLRLHQDSQATASAELKNRSETRHRWGLKNATVDSSASLGRYIIVPSLQQRSWPFSDLLMHVPALRTWRADVMALAEREKPQPEDSASVYGHVDDEARQLIENARSQTWERIAYPAVGGTAPFSIVYDGSGRHIYRRVVSEGLVEKVVCDGSTLTHAYPHVGIATTRPFSRFHRQPVQALVPWLLPSVEELRRHAEVQLIDAHTVAVVPLASETELSAAVAEAGTRVETHLVFAASGRLKERRLVESETGKVLLRTLYAADGLIRVVGENDEDLMTLRLQRTSVEAPDLNPDHDELLTVSMPIRSSAFVRAKMEGDHGKTGKSVHRQLMTELLASYVAEGNGNAAAKLIHEHFFEKGDRRDGFYVLLSRFPNQFQWEEDVPGSEGRRRQVDLRPSPEGSSLRQYIRQYISWMNGGIADAFEFQVEPSGNILVHQLATAHNLFHRWKSGAATEDRTLTQIEGELESALQFIASCQTDEMGWQLLEVVQEKVQAPELSELLANAAARFEQNPRLAWVAREQRVKALFRAGSISQARTLYSEMLLTAMRNGRVPRLSSEIRELFLQDGGTELWHQLISDGITALVEANRLRQLIQLSSQLRQQGDELPGSQALEKVIGCLGSNEDLCDVRLMVVERLRQLQDDRAEGMLKSLQEQPALQDDAKFWRYAASVADSLQHHQAALDRLERAMLLEFAERPDVIDVRTLRADYMDLMTRFERVIDAAATLESSLPQDFYARIIRAADQWRLLEDDPTDCCHKTAQLLWKLNQKELAWDYLTTPLAGRSGESAPWRSLAENLTAAKNFEMADIAWRRAFTFEQTNPEILLAHARMLLANGRNQAARNLLQQITDSRWQPRFDRIRREAASLLP